MKILIEGHEYKDDTSKALLKKCVEGAERIACEKKKMVSRQVRLN